MTEGTDGSSDRPAIALVDDDSTHLLLMKAQLTKLGANVTTFKSGDEFLRQRRGASMWDMVVIDYLMPRMNGIETIASLQPSLRETTNICMLSGEGSLGDTEKQKLAGYQVPFYHKDGSVSQKLFNIVQKRLPLNQPSSAPRSTSSSSIASDLSVQRTHSLRAWHLAATLTCALRGQNSSPKIETPLSPAMAQFSLAKMELKQIISPSRSFYSDSDSPERFNNKISAVRRSRRNSRYGPAGGAACGVSLTAAQQALLCKTLSESKPFLALKLSPEQVDQLVLHCSAVKYSALKVIVSEGTEWPYMGCILSGSVQMSSRKKGMIGALGTGRWFGNMKSAARVTATAEDTVVLVLIGVPLIEQSKRTPLEALKPQLTCSQRILYGLRVAKQIGEGMFGKVYVCAPSEGHPEARALKVMNKPKMEGQRILQQLSREISIHSRLQHPFVVRLHATFQCQCHVYVLMDLAPGGDFFDYLVSRVALNELEAKFYISNVLIALRYLHQQGVVYRDLKPENLVFASNGYLRLVDFGFVKKIEPNEKAFTICGTADYMAPEIACSLGHDQSVDYWSVGVLLFEMLTGRTPYWEAGGNVFEIAKRAHSKGFSFPEGTNQNSHVVSLTTSLLCPDPSARLGGEDRGVAEVMAHEWFDGMDWAALEKMELECGSAKPVMLDLKDDKQYAQFSNVRQKLWHCGCEHVGGIESDSNVESSLQVVESGPCALLAASAIAPAQPERRIQISA